MELALTEAGKLGIAHALVTCDKDNIASQKTILKNSGRFHQENIVDGKIKLSYWIDIQP